MSGKRSRSSFWVSLLAAFLTGLLLGGLAGAAAMLLVAPRSGERTRSAIQKQRSKLRHQAAESMDDMVTEAGDKAHQFTNSVQHGVDDLQHHAQELLT